ncbi:MAG TPA: 5-formyltetrahydrofolate cyclo-ligase [Clostridiaceae bacterium]|nr:5-formyltetrahydrofolate cyclo-ligase [Clostridiaceae bacterium]
MEQVKNINAEDGRSIKERKRAIRKRILEKRNAMAKSEVESKSKIIIEKLMSMDAWIKSNLIMSYVNFGNEVITTDFINKSLSEGKRIAVPFVAKLPTGNKAIIPCEINSLDNDLEKSSFGILEPKPNNRKEVDCVDIDLIIVPGIAFDNNKYRIGFGAGYYDRFLQSVKEEHLKRKSKVDYVTIGIAFEEQIVEFLPVESHDIPLDIIITEKRMIL